MLYACVKDDNYKGKGVHLERKRCLFSLFTQEQVTTCSVMEATEREIGLMLEESCPSFFLLGLFMVVLLAEGFSQGWGLGHFFP